jgi:anti-sigma28 factor (negative regulator of flagellin synthesis)
MASTIADITTTPVNIAIEKAASASAYDPRKMRSHWMRRRTTRPTFRRSARCSRPLRKPRRRSKSVCSDLVASLKSQIASGAYRPDPDAVAAVLKVS